ncbi:hypothetical protein Hanom_Chr05g00397351 [Helianthus anomalus]
MNYCKIHYIGIHSSRTGKILAKFTTLGYTRLQTGGKPSPMVEAHEHSPEGTTVR